MKDTEKVLKDLIDKSFSEFNLVQGSSKAKQAF